MLPATPFDDFINLLVQLRNAEDEQLPASFLVSQAGDSANLDNLADWMTYGDGGSASSSSGENHICLFVSNYDHAENPELANGFAERAGKGKTLLNEACKDRGVGLRVLEMAPTVPHDVMADWLERDCMAACAFGMEAAAAGGTILGVTALAGGSEKIVDNFVHSLERTSDANGLSSDVRQIDRENGLEILHCLRERGGREIAAMVGAITAARSSRLPIVIEGDAAVAALYALWLIDPRSINHVQIATQVSAQFATVMKTVGKTPIIGFENNFEPGCGLAIAMSALKTLASTKQ